MDRRGHVMPGCDAPPMHGFAEQYIWLRHLDLRRVLFAGGCLGNSGDDLGSSRFGVLVLVGDVGWDRTGWPRWI